MPWIVSTIETSLKKKTVKHLDLDMHGKTKVVETLLEISRPQVSRRVQFKNKSFFNLCLTDGKSLKVLKLRTSGKFKLKSTASIYVKEDKCSTN